VVAAASVWAARDWFREFDEMEHEMERMFEEEIIQDIEKVPK
jgi:hypothetical protein